MRAMSKKKPKDQDNTIAKNRRSRHDYTLLDTFEAGIALAGWEVKSAREGKVELTDTYVFIQNGEALLIGANFSPLKTVSTHYVTEPTRTRKLLLHKKELSKIMAATQQKGQTCVCTSMYWKGHLVKVGIALAKGKQDHDKRAAKRDSDWDRQKARIVRENVKQ